MEQYKTQQLLTLAQRHFGQNIQIEYKPSGLTSGWYLSKNDHSYCIGKTEWLDFLCSITRSEFDDILNRSYTSTLEK